MWLESEGWRRGSGWDSHTTGPILETNCNGTCLIHASSRARGAMEIRGDGWGEGGGGGGGLQSLRSMAGVNPPFRHFRTPT